MCERSTSQLVHYTTWFNVLSTIGPSRYIQSALSIADPDKLKQETTPLLRSGDFFKKIVVTAGNSKLHMDENGICYIGVIPFLLNPDSINA